MTTQNPKQTSETNLDDLLKTWTVPATPPWLKERAVNAMLAPKREIIWPWTTRWLATALSVATVVGGLGGAFMPASAADATEIIALLW